MNAKGTVLGEADTEAQAKQKMELMFTAEEIEKDEIEVIEGE